MNILCTAPNALELPQVYSCLIMVVGIPTVASTLGYFVVFIFGEQEDERKLRKVHKGNLGKDTLGQIDDFTKRLGEAGVRRAAPRRPAAN